MSIKTIIPGAPVVITETSSIKEVLQTAGESLVVIGKIEDVKKQLQLTVEKYKDFEVTKENFKESKEARAEVREIRYALQNVSKHNVSVFKTAQNKYKEDVDGLIGIVSPTEDKFDVEIKKIENEKKLEKEAKAKEEVDRVAKINREISDYRMKFEKIVSFGRKESDVKEFCSLVDEVAEKNANSYFEEFGFEIDNMISEYNVRLDELRTRVIQISNDAKQEEENRLKKKELERKEEIQNLGLVLVGSDYVYKDEVIYTANCVLWTDKEYNEAFTHLAKEVKKIKKQEAEVKAKKEAEAEAKAKAEFEAKAKEDAKLKKEKEDFAKEKAEFEQKKKEDVFNVRKAYLLNDGFISEDGKFEYNEVISLEIETIKNITDEEFEDVKIEVQRAKDELKLKLAKEEKEAKEKAKKEAIAEERKFNKTVEKAKKLGVSFSEVEKQKDKSVVINFLESEITKAEDLLTLERKKVLLDAGKVHVDNASSYVKELINYLSQSNIFTEHENAIVEFEDEIRLSLKKLTKNIS